MTGPRPVLDNGLGAGQGIAEVVTTPLYAAGTRATLKDGRVFYYARNSGSAITAGFLLAAEAVDAQNEGLATNTAQLGDTSVTVTFGTDTASANDYTGGYLCVLSFAGSPFVYEIAEHPAITSGGSVSINLAHPVVETISVSSTACVLKNRWQDIIHASGTDAMVVVAGVTSIDVPAGTTDKQYFWCQTWGVAGVRQMATGIVAGAPLTHAIIPIGSEGLVGYATGQTPEVVGTNLVVTTTLEFQPVFLKISQ